MKTPQYVQDIDIENFQEKIDQYARDFRICATALAWHNRRWWIEPGEPERCLTELVEHAIKALKGGDKEGSIATGGFKVTWFTHPPDYAVEIDISLELGHLFFGGDGTGDNRD
jgi:hypothetical protein